MYFSMNMTETKMTTFKDEFNKGTKGFLKLPSTDTCFSAAYESKKGSKLAGYIIQNMLSGV